MAAIKLDVIGSQGLTGLLFSAALGAAILVLLAFHRVGLVFARHQGRHTARQVTEAMRREAAAAYERLGDTQAWEPVSPR